MTPASVAWRTRRHTRTDIISARNVYDWKHFDNGLRGYFEYSTLFPKLGFPPGGEIDNIDEEAELVYFEIISL